MEASCSKDVSSSSEFSESFTGSDESIYSETSSETNSDSYIIQMNIMKMIFLKIYQLQWTLNKIKIMMTNGFR